MVRVVTLAGPGEVVLADEADSPLERGHVRVETLFSGISAGTELTQYRGSNPFRRRSWDPERRLFGTDESPREDPRGEWG